MEVVELIPPYQSNQSQPEPDPALSYNPRTMMTKGS
uniref:Uncharacterized protein n=1 Tax=Rhizophora mucronata TaxID=61149 RepID=A0A2P2JW73_RHIMU